MSAAKLKEAEANGLVGEAQRTSTNKRVVAVEGDETVALFGALRETGWFHNMF